MKHTTIERRKNPRFGLRLPLRYRISRKGAAAYTGSGLTLNMSAAGIAFRCRKEIPVGTHVEILVDWPTKHGDTHPLELQATGFVMRSGDGRTVVRMTAHRLRISEAAAEVVRATA